MCRANLVLVRVVLITVSVVATQYHPIITQYHPAPPRSSNGNDRILPPVNIPPPPGMPGTNTQSGIPSPGQPPVCPNTVAAHCSYQYGAGPSSICYCDAVCVIRDDCCADYRPYQHHDVITRHHILSHVECSEPNNYHIPQDLSILKQCPRNYPANMIRSLCEDPDVNDQLLSWPVSGKYNGLFYRNIYCATCWREQAPFYWKLRAYCRSSAPVMADATPEPKPKLQDFLRVCSTSFVSPFDDGVNLRHCTDVYVSTCASQTRNDIQTLEKCVRGPTVIVETLAKGDNKIVYYKNEDCAYCNGLTRAAIKCRSSGRSGYGVHKGVPGVGLSVLFDMNSLKVRSEGLWASGLEAMNMTCDSGHVFDLFMSECRPLFCKDNERYRDRTCFPDNATLLRDCSTVLVPKNEFTETNNTIHLKGTVTYLNESQYQRLNDSILVCGDLIVHDDITLYHLTGYLTTIGSSISCLFLALLLLVYALLPKLRNVPGKVTMSLAFTLLCAQLLFLVGIERREVREVCAGFAVMIHYFYLAAFAWMTLLSLDLTLTFRPMNTRSIVRKETGRYLRYSVYAWIMPCVVVCAGIVLDHFHNSTSPFNPGYGNRQCWFSNQMSLLVLFLLPVGIHILSNLIMFMYTVYNVCKVTRSVQMVRPVDECRLFLYLKLSVIMGTTWFLVYVWLLTHNTVVEILFIIFNSLQGTFICLAFVCRPKTFWLLRTRLSSGQQSRDVTPSTKRSSLSAPEKSASLLRGKRTSEDLWIEMRGGDQDLMLTAPLNGDRKTATTTT